MTTILTLQMDARSQEHFDALRQRYYPRELNQIAAHLTLFHTLPATDEVRAAIAAECAALTTFAMRVTGLRSLGRGVAYTLESPELCALQRRLASRLAEHISAQDRQKFQPHVVVQNKVPSGDAKALLAELSATFTPFNATACALGWWDYLGGPWRLRERIDFASRE